MEVTTQAYSVSERLLHVQLWLAGHMAAWPETVSPVLSALRVADSVWGQAQWASAYLPVLLLFLLFFPFSVSQPSRTLLSFYQSVSSFLAKTLVCFTCSQGCSALCSPILLTTLPPSDFNPESFFFSNWWVTPNPTPNGRICSDLTVKGSITTLVFCCEIFLYSKYIHYVILKYYFKKPHTLQIQFTK